MTPPRTPTVAIRPLPFPYRGAVTICNDIDGTRPDAFRAMHNLITVELGLEIGNSFWMYDVGRRDQAFAYLDGRGPARSAHAPMIRDLAHAHYLDVLHSYGNFLEVGEFQRDLAARAIETLVADEIGVKVWVNHGGSPQHQRLLTSGGALYHSVGSAFDGLGDRPGTIAYHADLMTAYGIRYSWDGLCWEIVGQERPAGLVEAYLSPRGSVRPLSVLRRATKGALALGRRRTPARAPAGRYGSLHTYSGDNHLLSVRTLLDGQQILEFKRYGAFSRDRASDLPNLLHPGRLRDLCRLGGYMLVYNHMGKGATAERPLPPEAVAALRHLAREQDAGRVLVATTSRLLEFCRLSRFLNWTWREEQGAIEILIAGILDPIRGPERIARDDLQGVAFRVPAGTRVSCSLDGAPIPMERAPEPGSSDWDALYLPWKRLTSLRL